MLFKDHQLFSSYLFTLSAFLLRVFIFIIQICVCFNSPGAFESTKWFIITRAVVNIIPAWTRFWQCLRRYRDSREAFPHLVNAGKYSTTFFVVLFSTLRAIYSGAFKFILLY